MRKESFTKEQKQAYFKALRERWSANKASSEQDTDAKARYEAILAEGLYKGGYASFYFTYSQMQEQKLDGLPYVDAKTFNGWKEKGFMVTKGAKSTLVGIVWKKFMTSDKQDDEDAKEYMYPKEYHLFHRSQVEPIA